MITDIPMPLLPWWLQLLIMSILLIISIVVHEQAHYKILTTHYKDAVRPLWRRDGWRFRLQVTWPTNALTKEQATDVYLAGVLFGLFPIILLLFFVDTLYVLTGLLLYGVGCIHDIKALWRLK